MYVHVYILIYYHNWLEFREITKYGVNIIIKVTVWSYLQNIV